MAHDYYDYYDEDDCIDCEDYLMEDCGMMADGQCLKAGSEFCDWDCGRTRDWGDWTPPTKLQIIWMEIKWPFVKLRRWVKSLRPERCPDCGKRPCEGRHDCIPF